MDVVVFQQFDSAEKKIEGIRRYAKNIVIKSVYSIDKSLPLVVDDPEKYVSSNFEADLVLNFLKNLDLSDYLIDICQKKSIPVVTTGKAGKGFSPFTCCGLGKSDKLGDYGKQFGFPEYSIEIENDRIRNIEVLRGAPCGATWAAIVDIVGCPVDEAMTKLPLRVQQNCFANPSAFDPISGKSPVHYAGYVHLAALRKAIADAANLILTH